MAQQVATAQRAHGPAIPHNPKCEVPTRLSTKSSHGYHACEFLEQAVFESGFPVIPASIAEAIMRRLVRTKRAEILPVPAYDLTERRPAVRRHLGAWLDVRSGDAEE